MTSNCHQLKRKALLADTFGRYFTLMLPDGNERYKSMLGSLLNIIRVAAVLVYASYKWIGLKSYSDSDIQTNVQTDYFSSEYVLSSEDGFKVGFGLSSYSTSP